MATRKGMSTCKGCGVKVPTVEAHIYSNKKYCSKCYEIKLQQKQAYDNLINYILYCFNISKPTGLILKQIKEYKEQFNYTVGGIHYALWYCNEIKNYKFDTKYGIAIIKYEYENAEKYYIQQDKIRNSIKNNKKIIKRVTVKPKIKRVNVNNLLIDIDNLIKKDGE